MGRIGFFLSVVICFFHFAYAWGEGRDTTLPLVDLPATPAFYLNGEMSALTRGGILASQDSLTYNNEGIEPEEGLNFYLRVPLKKESNPLEIYLEPLIARNGEIKGTIHKGYLRFKTRKLNVDLGKESFWWGQGRHGGLFLTNHAEPLHVVRLFNPDPYSLRYLGLFQFDIFISRLEADRVVPEPYFQGTRFTFKPNPGLEVGLTRTIIMGGEGRPGINLSKFLTIWFGENREGNQELSNSLAGIDARWILPGIEIYGELGGEDEAGYLPSHKAYLVGVHVPSGLFEKEFRLEYAHITDPAWYLHSLYQSGYTYRDRVLGHHVGGGGKDLYFEQGILKTDRVKGNLKFDYEERGVTTRPVTERHYQVGTDWTFEVGKGVIPWTIQTDFLYEWVENAGHKAELDEENALASVVFIGPF